MRVAFTNLGCKLNQAELESLARRFAAAGHRVVADLEDAELHVVNTCTVTRAAARTSRKTARRGGRRDPDLRTVLTGCYATGSPRRAAALAGVDLVVPNRDKGRLLEAVHRRFPDLRPSPRSGPDRPRDATSDAAEAARAAGPAGRELPFGNTRALVKAEDGCNVGCAFCIIPSTRGRQRSRPLPEVVAEVAARVDRGAREVVLEGVQISHYRHRGASLAELVAAILGRTAVPRLRLTSIAPWAVDRRLLALWRDPAARGRLCRHVHLALQSGCDATLRRMRRPYGAAAFAEAVAALREAAPGIAVTTDVIAGFPGETDAEFAQSLAFAERMEFARIHAFPYSTRPGTPGAELPDRVPPAVQRERMAALLDLATASERRFRARRLGRTVRVLWEGRRRGLGPEPGHRLWHGLTDNYLRVHAHGGEGLANTFGRVRLERLVEGGLLGRRVAAA